VSRRAAATVGHAEAVDSAARLVAEIGTLAQFLTEDRERQHDLEVTERLKRTNLLLARQIDELREALREELLRRRRLETQLEALRLANEVLREEAASLLRAAQPGLYDAKGGRRPWRRVRPE
jgi:chromosome segregation ATPase